jgi:hypothetical protein
MTSSPKSRRTPSLTRPDQIIPAGMLRRQISDPDLKELAAKSEAAVDPKKKEKSMSSKRFSRLSVVLGQLAPGVESSDDGHLEIPDFIGALVIELLDGHNLRPSMEHSDFTPEINPFCVFRVGEQESRSLVASRGSMTWNERLNVLCEAGADALVLDVYDYISLGREQIIGSATLELRHLFLGGFSDEWNDFSLRVDKDSGGVIDFRCCFKPFVGPTRCVFFLFFANMNLTRFFLFPATTSLATSLGSSCQRNTSSSTRRSRLSR